MRVAKWGNSLAVRVPSAVAEALELKEGDEVEIRLAGSRTFEIAKDLTREQALERIEAARWKLPPDWKFDRDDALRTV